MGSSGNNSFFDFELYGALVKHQRRKMGYKTAKALSTAIEEQAHVHVSKDTIYKIEQGKQVPDAMQFMAINAVLMRECLPHQLLSLCLGKDVVL